MSHRPTVAASRPGLRPRRARRAPGVLACALLLAASAPAPPARGQPAERLSLTAPCVAPTRDELVPGGTNARGERILERRASPARDACRRLRQRTIARVLGGRIDFCDPGGKRLLRDTLPWTMQLPQGDEDQWIGAGFLFNEGCTPHDCGRKAFVAMDTAGAHGVVGLLDCVRPGDAAGHYDRILYLFSDVADAAALPDAVRGRIEAWRAAVEQEERHSCRCPFPRVREVFVPPRRA